MKVKALTSFGGQYAMYKGAVAELPDNDVTDILLAEGYIEATDEEEVAGAEKIEEESEEEIEAEAADSEEKTIAEMTRPELLAYAEESGIEVDKKARKDDLVKMIESALAKK